MRCVVTASPAHSMEAALPHPVRLQYDREWVKGRSDVKIRVEGAGKHVSIATGGSEYNCGREA